MYRALRFLTLRLNQIQPFIPIARPGRQIKIYIEDESNSSLTKIPLSLVLGILSPLGLLFSLIETAGRGVGTIFYLDSKSEKDLKSHKERIARVVEVGVSPIKDLADLVVGAFQKVFSPGSPKTESRPETEEKERTIESDPQRFELDLKQFESDPQRFPGLEVSSPTPAAPSSPPILPLRTPIEARPSSPIEARPPLAAPVAPVPRPWENATR